MAGRITAIERGREGLPLTVYVDGAKAFTVSEDLASRLGLEIGAELAADDIEHMDTAAQLAVDDIERIDTGDERVRAREAALRLLSVRARSRRELLDRLKRKGFHSDVAGLVVEALAETGLVDDREFARLWADERMRLRPVGSRRLRQELAAKGVPSDVVADIVRATYEAHPEAGLARRVLDRRARGIGVDDLKARARLHAFLVRRGFSHATAAQALRDLRTEDDG